MFHRFPARQSVWKLAGECERRPIFDIVYMSATTARDWNRGIRKQLRATTVRHA